MSTLPAAEATHAPARRVSLISPAQAAASAALLAILGISAIRSTAMFLWGLWTTDALKSIGMLIPIVSLILILRVWRRLHWEMNGTWWGLALLMATVAAVHIRDQSVLVFVLSPQWSIYMPPHSLVVFAYASGVVLLFGGTLLYRKALFPIVLLWFVNPVPHVFNVLVDLPLQRASAHIARGFAHALGQPLSPDQLRLMFTPEFGMFIAPGCNGIRGAVTMGFIALIAGYLYRFRWRAHAAVVVCAVLLGYVFNFLRLCVLVLYYIVALHFPSLQDKAENGDYVIGACLFLMATFLLFYVVRRLADSKGQIRPEPSSPEAPEVSSGSVYGRLAAMLAIAIFGLSGMAHARPTDAASAAAIADSRAMGRFPAKVGSYTLSRTWNENLVEGTLLFHWADYEPAGGGPHIQIGISPVLGTHDTLVCHSARGEDPLWHSQLTMPTANDLPVDFSASFFNDGATQYLEATTICSGGSCGEHSTDGVHFGFVYSRPDPKELFSQDAHRPIPILLRAETIDTTLPPEVARQRMTEALRSFLASADLAGLTQPYRSK